MTDSGNKRSRIRIKKGNVEFEVEGSETMVERHLKKIKEEGLGMLTGAIVGAKKPRKMPDKKMKTKKPNYPKTTTKEKIEPIPELVKIEKTGAKMSESEWVLIYGYWISKKEGKSEFSRSDVLLKYKQSLRYTATKRKNLTRSIKTCLSEKNKWFGELGEVSDDNLYTTDKGIAKAEELISKAFSTSQEKEPKNG